MSAPASLPEWDTNGTHIGTPTTSGHKTDGWVTNEVPASAEMGYWMNLVYKWINWLSTNGGDKYAERDMGFPGGAFCNASIPYLPYALQTIALNNVVWCQLPVEAGDTITQIDFYTHSALTTTSTFKLQNRQQGTNITDFVDVASTTGNAATPDAAVTTLTPNHVVLSGYVYRLYIKLTTDAFAVGTDIYGANVYRKRV